MTPNALQIVRVLDTIPDDFAALRAEASGEGYGFVEGLWDEWTAGRYAGGDERSALFAAFSLGSLAALGAVTPDPYDPAPDLLRMRHVYVRPTFRRGGAGRALAAALVQQGLELAPRLSLNAADTRAAAFWEAMGFHRVATGIRRTHLLEG